jgi:hypothetical protein
LNAQTVPVACPGAASSVVETAQQTHIRERRVRAADSALTARPARFAQRLRPLAVRREESLPLRLEAAHAAQVLLPERLRAAFGDPDPQPFAAGEISTLELGPVDEPHRELERQLALRDAPALRVDEFPPAATGRPPSLLRTQKAFPPGAHIAAKRGLARAHDSSPRKLASAAEASSSM